MDDASSETCLVWLNNMNKNKNIVWFIKFSLKHEQNIFYISFKKLYTFHLWTKRFFLQKYKRWGNTVTYSIKTT